jgi:hypothetical protein
MSNRVKHIAFFKFKADRTPEQIAEVWRIVEDLPKRIPGILDLTWGVNNSTEGLSPTCRIRSIRKPWVWSCRTSKRSLSAITR